jgi:hypothetical protein
MMIESSDIASLTIALLRLPVTAVIGVKSSRSQIVDVMKGPMFIAIPPGNQS